MYAHGLELEFNLSLMAVAIAHGSDNRVISYVCINNGKNFKTIFPPVTLKIKRGNNLLL